MIQFFLIALLIMALVCAVVIITAVIQGRRAKKTLEDYQSLQTAFLQVKEKAERLQKALSETAKVEERANEERKELAEASDADLAVRANNLFLTARPRQ